MVMIKRVLALLGSGTLAILLLRQAETAAQAVRDGVQLCLTSVIPALFPFFAVSSLLVALGAAEAAGRALARPFGRLQDERINMYSDEVDTGIKCANKGYTLLSTKLVKSWHQHVFPSPHKE